MKYHYFYKTTNLVNDKVYYGVHSTDNLDDGYIGSGKLIKKAIKKYGYNNFKKIILEWFDNEIEMFTYEKHFITEDFIIKNDNYNLAPGGFGGYRKEAVEANRKKRRGKKWEEIYSPIALKKMKKIAKENVGRLNDYNMKNISKEKRIENAKKANRARQESGYVHSEETKRKIGESQKGNITPEETKRKISQTLKEKSYIYKTPEYREKLSRIQKKRYEKQEPKITKYQVEQSIKNTKNITQAVEYANNNFVNISSPTFDKYKKLYDKL